MLKVISRSIALGLLAGSTLTALPAQAAQITYTGMDTQGDVQFNYSITTDGKLGSVALSNIVSSSITYTGLSTVMGNNHNFSSFTAYNNLYFTNLDDDGNEKASPVSATLTDLFFDFGGSGDLNMSPVNCAGINMCDMATNATPNEGQQGLVYAFAGQNTNEYGSVVYHDDGMGGRTLPTKELDDFARSQDYRLQPGFYTQVAATNQSFASAAAMPAVPEPATWAMMILGMGAVGYAMRRKMRLSDLKFDARIKSITYGSAA